jgi:hypothetical protein
MKRHISNETNAQFTQSVSMINDRFQEYLNFGYEGRYYRIIDIIEAIYGIQNVAGVPEYYTLLKKMYHVRTESKYAKLAKELIEIIEKRENLK